MKFIDKLAKEKGVEVALDEGGGHAEDRELQHHGNARRGDRRTSRPCGRGALSQQGGKLVLIPL
jgi:hypothetical protein